MRSFHRSGLPVPFPIQRNDLHVSASLATALGVVPAERSAWKVFPPSVSARDTERELEELSSQPASTSRDERSMMGSRNLFMISFLLVWNLQSIGAFSTDYRVI